MSSLKDLSGKSLEVELKRGLTIEDFARKYECTQEDFLNHLEKNFCEKARKSITRSMTKNAKKRKPTRTTKTKIHEGSKTILQEDKKVNDSTTENSDLQNLKERERLLISEISKKEKIHERSISERMKLFDELRQKKEKMLELKEIIEQNYKEVEKISTQIVKITERIAAENKKMSTNKQKLEEVESCIRKLEKIPVFVYKNGEIEIENADIPETSGWESLFDSLIHNKIVENLSLKQVRQLAKLLVIVECFQAQEQNYELTFESETEQRIFEKL